MYPKFGLITFKNNLISALAPKLQKMTTVGGGAQWDQTGFFVK